MTPAVGKLTPDQRRQIATAFLATVKWSRISMRGGAATPANDGVARVTMRLFAKGCPQGCLRDVLQILSEKSPVMDPLIESTLEPGEWHHKAAWWAKDTQSSKNGDATVTLFRELSDGPVSETNVIEDGCSSRTTIRYVWDSLTVEAPESIEHSGEQGFVVRIGGVARDRETELYNYYVTVTEEKTKTLGEVQTGEDAFSEDYATTVTGIRGTMAAPVSDTGEILGSAGPGDQPAGTVADVSWELNKDNCTLAVQTRRRKAKQNVLAARSDSRDIFSHDEGTDTLAVLHDPDDPLAAHLAPAPANGVTESRTVKLRADRLHDESMRRKTELPVSAAEVTLSEDIFRKQTRTADKSQPVAAATGLLPSAAEGVAITYQIGKTPGDLRDIVKNEVEDLPVTAAEVSKSTDIFHEQTQTTDKSQPVAAEAACVPSAADGTIISFQIGKTATDLRDIAKVEKKELLVESASVTLAEDLYSKATRTTDRAIPIAAAALLQPSAEDGVSISYQIEKTPGNLRAATKSEEIEYAVESAESGAAVDAYQGQESTTDKSMPAAAADLLAPSVEDGVIISYRKSKTKGKRRDVVKSRTEEYEVPEAEINVVKSVRGTVTTVSGKSVRLPLELAEGELGRVAKSITRGKRLDVSKTTTLPAASGTVLSESKGGGVEFDYFRVTTVESEKVYGSTGLVSAGFLREVSFDVDEATGGYTKTVMEKTAKAPQVYLVQEYKQHTSLVVTYQKVVWLFVNCPWEIIQNVIRTPDGPWTAASPAPMIEIYVIGGLVEVSLGVSINAFGLWSGSVTRVASGTSVNVTLPS